MSTPLLKVRTIEGYELSDIVSALESRGVYQQDLRYRAFTMEQGNSARKVLANGTDRNDPSFTAGYDAGALPPTGYVWACEENGLEEQLTEARKASDTPFVSVYDASRLESVDNGYQFSFKTSAKDALVALVEIQYG